MFAPAIRAREEARYAYLETGVAALRNKLWWLLLGRVDDRRIHADADGYTRLYCCFYCTSLLIDVCLCCYCYGCRCCGLLAPAWFTSVLSRCMLSVLLLMLLLPPGAAATAAEYNDKPFLSVHLLRASHPQEQQQQQQQQQNTMTNPFFQFSSFASSEPPPGAASAAETMVL